MSKVFLDKVLKREFDDLSLEELSVIVAYDEVFSACSCNNGLLGVEINC